MTDFDFTSFRQLDDVESKNVDALLKKLHFPAHLRWRIIRRTSRDNARTPMQWDASENAGFTTGRPWLGVNGNYRRINAAAQKDDPFSVRSYYKSMIELRSLSETLRCGKFKLLAATHSVLVYERSYEGRHAVVLLNFSGRPRRCGWSGQVVIASSGRDVYDGTLQPFEGVILNEGVRS